MVLVNFQENKGERSGRKTRISLSGYQFIEHWSQCECTNRAPAQHHRHIHCWIALSAHSKSNEMKREERQRKKNWFWFLSWVDAYMSLCHFGTNLKFFFAMVSFFRFNAIDRFSLLGAALAVQCHFIMRTLYFTVSVSILHSFYGPFSGDMQRTASVSLVTKN